jgi:branched-chain amino acid transport system permease protein
MSGPLSSISSGLDRITGKIPAPLGWLLGIGAAVLFGLSAGNGNLMDASIQTLAFVIMALGLNIVVGFAGLLDLGYVAFYAIGAFVAGYLMSPHFASVNGGEGIHFLAQSENDFGGIPGIHINFWIVAFLAAAFTALWGALLGAPTLRLRGDYVAIVTLAFGEIVPRVFENSTEGLFGFIGNTDWSNGRQGITPIDKITLIPGVESTAINYTENLLYVFFVALAMLCLVIFVNRRLRDSRIGRAWIAVREDEVAAAAQGVNLVRTKLWAYAIGAALGGFAGVFLGAYNNTVNVDQFEFGFSVFILAMIILGGLGNILGVILGAIALSMINRFLLPQLDSVPEAIGLDFDVTAVSFGIFGFLLVLMMVIRPEGLVPNRRRALELHEGEIEGGENTGVVSTDQMYEVRQA